MKKTLIIGSLLSILFVQCTEDKDPFLISKGAIGSLTKEIQMKQVDSIFAQDSIVKLSPVENALGTQGEVEVYEKGGEKLLLLSPNDDSDPNSVITNIQVFDPRFKTEKGLNVNSTFGDIKANYEVVNVETTINAVVVFLKDSEIYVTIDKKELPENLRYNMSAEIEVTQIPDTAKFKYFMIGWDMDE
ncbi:MAG: hypothetical protein HKN48_13475 [Flavobacteriaceae bacterium]|nr:hypothetical protein [Flavobacteriaceae bacterium]